MDWLSAISGGTGHTDVALLLNRVAVGTFFAISGAHKLFNKDRHQRLVETLKDAHVPVVGFNQWWVPGWEFFSGTMIFLGIFAPLFTIPLMVICYVACATEGKKVVESYHPIDSADRLDDWLYTPEALYMISLLIVLFAGPGAWSLA